MSPIGIIAKDVRRSNKVIIMIIKKNIFIDADE